jgi:hypothetical protein
MFRSRESNHGSAAHSLVATLAELVSYIICSLFNDAFSVTKTI